MKCNGYNAAADTMESRPPRGGRGLKFHAYHRPVKGLESPPSRGAWIEIGENERSWTASGGGVAPLAGGVD